VIAPGVGNTRVGPGRVRHWLVHFTRRTSEAIGV
jgi:hypothetical protein